jgi:3-hydroxyisobutyrate dehydrogenase-like beta-hydroxyacid dehydrogenase
MTAIAFLGLGKMGLAMALNVQRAGFPITVWNRSPEKAQPLAAAGASLAASPDQAVAAADIVITSLADDASVESVVMQPDGVLAGLRPDCIHVGTSTISPKLADRLAQAHAAHGACPPPRPRT